MSILKNTIGAVLEQHVLPYVKNYYEDQSNHSRPLRPFILGLTGLQGSGKSTWASKIVDILRRQYQYNTITVSLDDFYHDHAHLVAIAAENSTNLLLQTRGQPGTHDEVLATKFFESLDYKGDDKSAHNQDMEDQILIPSFDKSRYGGEGDRAAQEQWKRVPKTPHIDIVVFEGWCIGFQPLLSAEVYEKWTSAKNQSPSSSDVALEAHSSTPIITLQDHQLDHLEVVNQNLTRYCDSFMGPQHFDHLVHLDTDDLHNVYQWRLQQEQALRLRNEGAMTDDGVKSFVKGYMPAYELYLDQLRQGFFPQEVEKPGGGSARRKGHTRVVLDPTRRVMSVTGLSGGVKT